MQSSHHPPLARQIGLIGLGFGIGAIAKLTLSRRSAPTSDTRSVKVRTTVTVRRDRADVYRFWRDLRNLPLFMRHVQGVTESDGHSKWHALGPGRTRVEWEAEITVDRANERIAWRSLDGAALPNHGSVEFKPAPDGQGTEVHLELGFEPPLGAFGAGLARLFHQVPEVQIKNDLRRLKQILETGEVVHSDASIHRGLHPARPVSPEQLPLLHGLVRS